MGGQATWHRFASPPPSGLYGVFLPGSRRHHKASASLTLMPPLAAELVASSLKYNFVIGLLEFGGTTRYSGGKKTILVLG